MLISQAVCLVPEHFCTALLNNSRNAQPRGSADGAVNRRTVHSLRQRNIVAVVFRFQWVQPEECPAMRRTTIDPDLSVDEIMRRWPTTIRPFLRRGMLCVGCPIGVFHTVMDACAAHGVDPDAFAAELSAALLGILVTETGPGNGGGTAEREPTPGGRCGG